MAPIILIQHIVSDNVCAICLREGSTRLEQLTEPPCMSTFAEPLGLHHNSGQSSLHISKSGVTKTSSGYSGMWGVDDSEFSIGSIRCAILEARLLKYQYTAPEVMMHAAPAQEGILVCVLQSVLMNPLGAIH